MLLHLPIVILAAFSPVAVSDDVPKFDIVRECRFEGGATVEPDRCSNDEDAALRELEKAWAQFAVADKRNCIVAATIGGFASYVEWPAKPTTPTKIRAIRKGRIRCGQSALE